MANLSSKQLAQRRAARAAWGAKYEGTELHREWARAGYQAAAKKWGYGRIQSIINRPNYAGEKFYREARG